MKKPLAIGIENYKMLIDKPYYYVDKSLMIKDLLDKGGAVNLFTRPRRFGKTLTLSMLRTFFEAELDDKGAFVDNRHYFEGKRILAEGESYTSHMGKYPVISLSLKSAKQPDYEMAYASLLDEIIREYVRHRYVLTSNELPVSYREKYEAIMNRRAEAIDYAKSLVFLSECLKAYHKTKTIILLDEYDVPLENAFFAGFYDEMITFIRSLFESALKTNDSLEFAVITGCLRISRESIFTGLNNLKMNTILDNDFAEYFGFMQNEVEEMLCYYGLNDRLKEAKHWYDGYLFGDTEVYNPWSMINYVKTAISNTVAFPKPYWSNTSSNNIVRQLIERSDDTVKGEIETLIAGGTIEKPIHEDITYEDIYKTQNNLWNFLFFTGYLKAVSQRFEVNTIYLTMQVPNEEVKYIYENTIREWFEQQVKGLDLSVLYQGLMKEDSETIQGLLRIQLRKTISYYDANEAFYHGFLLGILNGIPGYHIQSNRESGSGRPDLMLIPLDEEQPVIIIEIKKVQKLGEMTAGAKAGLAQIEQQEYAAAPLEEGYLNILSYGICFCKKSCVVICNKIK